MNYNLHKTLNTFITNTREILLDVPSNSLNFSTELYEFRMVILNLPRRSGKTMALVKLANEHSALLIVPNTKMVDVVRNEYKFSLAETLKGAYAKYGHDFYNNSNLKYSLVLVDELKHRNLPELYEVIARLACLNMLTEDFVVVWTKTE